MTNIDETKEYVQYARQILSGEIRSGRYIKLACQRFLDWFERDDIYFDYEKVDKYIRFISKLKHWEGRFNGQPFILMPWQEWCVANIIGWLYKDTHLRVTRNVLMFVARKNGKTALSAALGIALATIDGEAGAEIDLLANSAKQAGIAFKQVKNYVGTLDRKQQVYKQYQHEIRIPRTHSNIQILSSDSMGNDGYNSHVTILDEFHAAKNWDTYNVMKSSMGMRSQPLMIVITTAGFLLSPFPLYTMTETCKEILSGVKEDDSQFSALYMLDEEDDWHDEANWIKASPSLGVAVEYEYMKEAMTRALNTASLETGIKTKNLNMFCEAKDIWIQNKYVEDAMEYVDLKDYQYEIAFGGLDLSSVSDITSFSICIPPNPEREHYPDKFIFKSWLYLPEEALDTSSNSGIYNDFIHSDEMRKTSGNVVDYDEILHDVKEVNDQLSMIEWEYDKWNSTQFAINATEIGLILQPYSQALGSFNGPTKTFEMLLKQGKIVIDKNSVIAWMMRNVELKIDWNENIKPIKANNVKTNKIDGVISMLEALGGYLNSPEYCAS